MRFQLDAHLRNVRPFPYALVKDPFLIEDLLEDEFPLSTDFPSQSVNRMDQDMTFPQPEYLNLILKSKAYKDLHSTIYSESFIRDTLCLFKDEIKAACINGLLVCDPFELEVIVDPIELNFSYHSSFPTTAPFIYSRLDIGQGGLGYGLNNGGGGIHVDNSSRLISVLYYVNTNTSMIGGDFRGYSFEQSQDRMKHEFSVTPEKGLMLASLQMNHSFHDVDPIQEITGFRKAFYIAISCSRPIWVKGDQSLMKRTVNRYQGSNSLLFRAKRKFSRIF